MVFRMTINDHGCLPPWEVQWVKRTYYSTIHAFRTYHIAFYQYSGWAKNLPYIGSTQCFCCDLMVLHNNGFVEVILRCLYASHNVTSIKVRVNDAKKVAINHPKT